MTLGPTMTATGSAAAAGLPPAREDAPPFGAAASATLPHRTLSSRWSGSAWGFARRGAGPQLATGGTLGGSQVGGRIGYRLNGDAGAPLSLVARFYSSVGEKREAEGSIGFEWKPLAALPVTFLAERRQSIGSRGRSAFAVMAHGGVSERRLAGPLLLDAYAQAGMVGLKSRDLFVDGSAVIGLPIVVEGLKVGAGLWGAAQPGASRIDVGPQISYRLPIEGRSVRVSAGWRIRAAGDAAPGSGPALTLSPAF